MLKLDLRQTVLESAASSDVDLESVRCLLVLIPADIDHSAATRRIWQLANSVRSNVLLFGLCTDPADEPRLRRELITMASLLHDGRIAVETKVEIGTNWLSTVKTLSKADDMIVCFAEQRTGLLRRPVSQILESNLNTTVYILSGLIPEKTKPNKLFQISAWLGSLVIIMAFTLLQSQVVQLQDGWVQSVLLILSLIPEFWLIWVWNGLLS